MRSLLVIVTVFLFSCQSQQETKAKNEKKELKPDSTLSGQQESDSAKADATSSSFLDSIAKKYELSIEQIRNHTFIDSVYYTGIFSDVGFSGDTVLSFRNGFKGAIINYDDRRSCIYKFLLVINPDNQISVNKIIYTDCDHDESVDYTTLRYKFLNDSIFETTETYIPAKGKTQETEKLKWKISNTGTTDSL
jgi:hypothetical protein